MKWTVNTEMQLCYLGRPMLQLRPTKKGDVVVVYSEEKDEVYGTDFPRIETLAYLLRKERFVIGKPQFVKLGNCAYAYLIDSNCIYNVNLVKYTTMASVKTMGWFVSSSRYGMTHYSEKSFEKRMFLGHLRNELKNKLGIEVVTDAQILMSIH